MIELLVVGVGAVLLSEGERGLKQYRQRLAARVAEQRRYDAAQLELHEAVSRAAHEVWEAGVR